jgi:hypothetical protein
MASNDVLDQCGKIVTMWLMQLEGDPRGDEKWGETKSEDCPPWAGNRKDLGPDESA